MTRMKKQADNQNFTEITVTGHPYQDHYIM